MGDEEGSSQRAVKPGPAISVRWVGQLSMLPVLCKVYVNK